MTTSRYDAPSKEAPGVLEQMSESTPELRFDGKVAIVTGAANGVGRAHATLLASRGARVVVNDLGGAVTGGGRSLQAARAAADAIVALGGEAVADGNSVADAEGARRIIGTALDAWGRVDIVINNAGVLDTDAFEEANAERDDLVIATHLRGAMHVTKSAWAVMRRQGYGRVVNTSSGAVFGSPAGLAYQSAKAGVLGLTRGLAVLGRDLGITVNAILPTAFTRMTDSIPDPAFRDFMATRFTPERVAAFAILLAHEDCPVTGEAFLVGGGRVSRLLLGASHGVVVAEATPEVFAANFDQILDMSAPVFPVDRLAEFQSYLGRLGFESGGLSMTGLVDPDSSDSVASPPRP